MVDWYKIITLYVCPFIGVVISIALYSAPVRLLAKALKEKNLSDLNPNPWAVMTGNCFGWLAYAYYSRDPFILASNTGGMVVSFWLNVGASKLQYYAEAEGCEDPSNISLFTYQDVLTISILILWMAILVCVGWLGLCKGFEQEVVGLLVNMNTLFFYAAPLQTMKRVVSEKRSNSIHTLTVILNCTNAGFWGVYGIAMNNVVIYGPNIIGLALGLIQATLLLVFPKRSIEILTANVDDRPLLNDTDNEEEVQSDRE